MKILIATCIGAALAVLCLAQRPRGDGSNPCYHDFDEIPDDNLTACLDYIREVVYDTDSYFFGNDYREKCAGDQSIDCYNPFGYDNSIGSIVLGANSMLDSMDRFLYVEYTSEAFEYEGCGTQVRVPRRQFALDMSLEEHFPVETREMPTGMFWTHDDGDFYTLIILDVGAGFVHGVVTNIPGNDIASGDVISDYTGMLNFRFTLNPYVFMLFKQQNGNLRLSNSWQRVFDEGSLLLQVPRFQNEYNLIGPVAMNVLLLTTDIYGVSRLQEELPSVLQNCATFVARALNRMEAEFLPDDISLTGLLDVSIKSEDIRFNYCCEDQFRPARTSHLDAIGDRFINASDARTGSDIDFMFSPNTLSPNVNDWEDVHFMIVTLDADVPLDTVGSGERPLIHYLRYNMRLEPIDNLVAAINEGETMVEWRGPAPTDGEPHRYYTFLMAQAGEFSREEINLDDYLGDNCEGGAAGRCLFDIRRFAEEKDLALIGANWFRTRNDDFVNMLWERDEEEFCDGRYPCPTPPPPAGAGAPHVTALLLAVTSAVAVLRM